MHVDGFSRKKKFKATKEVYGVDPMELADMTYRDAAVVMYIHAKREYDRVCMEYFNLPAESGDYSDMVKLSLEMKKYSDAIELSSLKLREIGIDCADIDWKRNKNGKS